MKRFLLTIAVFTLALASLAETYDVSIGDNFFDPQIISISPGDRVRWTNNGVNTHRVKSKESYWDSGFLAPGETYTRTFNTAGRFDYNDPQYPSTDATVIVVSTRVEETSWGQILSLYR